jgi:hypothetical protein
MFQFPSDQEPFIIAEMSGNHNQSLERALGFPLTWHNPESKAMCRLFTRKSADFLDEKLWPEQFAWLKARLEIMHRVFAPVVKEVRV